MKLRSPHDTEAFGAGEIVVGRGGAALRRTAAVGVAGPAAAAQQTGRTSRRSGGVCKWA